MTKKQPATQPIQPVKKERKQTRDFNPDEFIVPSQDENGKSESVTLRIPARWLVEMDGIVMRHKFPFQTRNDMVRHALMREFGYLASLDPEGMRSAHLKIRATASGYETNVREP